MPSTRLPCQLYLVLTTDPHGAGLERLEAALRAGGAAIACVLLRLPGGHAQHHAELQTAVHRVQAHDIAVLIADDTELARELGADGVHLSPAMDEDDMRSRYAIARATLGSERTIGASAGLSPHNAMVLGEIGADYVAFEPEPDSEESSAPNALAQWWAPLFEVPVVALGVESAAEADRLAAAGVEFVGVLLDDGTVESMAQHVARMAEAITTSAAAGTPASS